MTETELRMKYVNAATKYYGCRASDGTHRPIIDLYNSHKPLARGYKVTYTDAWCATFVSAMAIECGFTDIIPTECSCSKQIELFKKLGRWVEIDTYVPKAGDIIYYDWDDNGIGENTGAPEHVGIVTAVNGSSILVIEGNMGNAVNYRRMNVNGRYIRGYGVPHYASKVEKEKPAASYKPTVLEWQKAAVADGFRFPRFDTDGIWGDECADVAKKAIVRRRIVYKYKNLTKIVQKVVGVEVDGLCGPNTRKAIIAYQEKHGLEADGEVGINTWKKILGVK